MKDRFLNDDEQFVRLYSDYKKHNKLIVAFDLDNTIYDYHKRGDTFPKLLSLLKKCQELDFELVCFTATDNISNIASTLHPYGIIGYSINASSVKSATIKPYFNILLDDRAGLSSSFKTLHRLIDFINNKQKEPK